MYNGEFGIFSSELDRKLDCSLRTCKACKREKDLSRFKKSKECKAGYRYICKQCYNDKNRKIPLSPEGMQFCRKCKNFKPLEELSQSTNCLSGYRYRCKECTNKRYIKKGKPVFHSGWFKKGHPGYKNSGNFKPGERRSPETEFKKGQIPWSYIDGKSNALHYKLTNGRRYNKLRKLVKERDNNMCTKCEKSENLHVHHIISLRQNPSLSHDIENLITLCAKCHVSEERISNGK